MMAGQAVYDMFLTNMPGMKPAAVETEGSQEDVAVKLKWLPTADELLHAEEPAPADDGKANGAEVWASLLTSAARPLKRHLSQLALENDTNRKNSFPQAIGDAVSFGSCQNWNGGGCQLALHDVEKKDKIEVKIPEKEDEKMEVKIPERKDEKMEVEIKEKKEKIEVKIPEKEDEKMEVKIPETKDEKMEVEIKEKEAEKIEVKGDEKIEVKIPEKEDEKMEVEIPEKEDEKMEVEIKEKEDEKMEVEIKEKEDEKIEVKMKEDTPEEIAEPPLKKRQVKKTFAQRYQPQSEDAGLRWQVIRDVFVKELQPIIKTPASFEDSFYKQCQTAFKANGAQDSVTLVAVATEQCALWMESRPDIKK